MKRFAFGIRFKTGSNNELMVGRCLKVLHGYQCLHNINSIGVTFPGFSDKTIGEMIGFVSADRLCLRQLMTQDYFQEMVNLKKFFIHEIMVVPDNVSEVRYMRDQKRDKQCVGGRQRQIRRGQRIAKKAGYDYQPRQDKAGSEHQINFFHNIPITSSRDAGKVFYFRIQKYAVDDKVYGKYSSYGLGNQGDGRGTVPDPIFINI
ncbi:type I-F CRISPR-associated endoribonuclease Cas6/Csy4 [Endozoicomonas acroporae]|uniref:type I-F CRISPR-associated endoribonuclease Cas6/Csy4 n=1 Tax=Endozoicomonas acroporae TaxID=1701104 RepID=UPI003D7B45C2